MQPSAICQAELCQRIGNDKCESLGVVPDGARGWLCYPKQTECTDRFIINVPAADGNRNRAAVLLPGSGGGPDLTEPNSAKLINELSKTMNVYGIYNGGANPNHCRTKGDMRSDFDRGLAFARDHLRCMGNCSIVVFGHSAGAKELSDPAHDDLADPEVSGAILSHDILDHKIVKPTLLVGSSGDATRWTDMQDFFCKADSTKTWLYETPGGHMDLYTGGIDAKYLQPLVDFAVATTSSSPMQSSAPDGSSLIGPDARRSYCAQTV